MPAWRRRAMTPVWRTMRRRRSYMPGWRRRRSHMPRWRRRHGPYMPGRWRRRIMPPTYSGRPAGTAVTGARVPRRHITAAINTVYAINRRTARRIGINGSATAIPPNGEPPRIKLRANAHAANDGINAHVALRLICRTQRHKRKPGA